MAELIQGDDGLPAEEVGSWATEKHGYLGAYIDISHGARARYLGPANAGATYVDLFCGTGRARIRKTGEWIDGSCVTAWKRSAQSGSPFSAIYIADRDSIRRQAAAERLRRLGAPVIELPGDAVSAVHAARQQLNPYGLHFAFIDPYNLGNCRFDIISALAQLKRIDMLVHVSRMDLQRNLGFNIKAQASAFDHFAPGWRSAVNTQQSQKAIRVDVFRYWTDLVRDLGVWPSTEMKLLTGEQNQPLYWLLLAAKHQLPHKLWAAVTKSNQSSFGF